jgi:hypothetical protein
MVNTKDIFPMLYVLAKGFNKQSYKEPNNKQKTEAATGNRECVLYARETR